MRIKIILTLGFILGILFYSGCIPADDISAVWNEGVLDPALEGHWKKMGNQYRYQDRYISFLKKEKESVYEIEMTGTQYSHQLDEMSSDFNTKARCLSVNGWGIIIIDASDIINRMEKLSTETKEETKDEEASTKRGGFILYKIENDTLSLYQLNQSVLAKAITDGNIQGIIEEEDIAGPRIKKLDLATINYITMLANQKDNITDEKYERVQDLQKALKESKAYPATDKTAQNTLIDVDFPELNYFAEGKTHILLRQLQASPEWEVRGNIHGEIHCSRRIYKDGEWQGGRSAYRSRIDDGIYKVSGFYQISDSFDFTDEPYGPYEFWAKDDYVMKVGPEVGEINLKLKLNDQGIMSCIAIGQKGLWYEFYEQRKKEPRVHTRRALVKLKSFLEDVKKAENEIQQKGYAKNLLPKGTIKIGKPSIDIQESSQGSRFAINAWINPQKSGYVYLKLFDNVKNKQMADRTMKVATNEYTGYSTNPDELFSYNCLVLDYNDEWDDFTEARFEMWFHPNDGGEEVKLIEATKKI